jgi:hypothetical protein
MFCTPAQGRYLRLIPTLMRPARGAIRCARSCRWAWSASREASPPRTDCRAELEQAATSADRVQAARARPLLETLRRDGNLAPTYPYPVQTWRLGDGPHWVFLGGEVVVDFAGRLKSELGPGRTWVVGYCNDVMAYIASRRVLAEGGYEGAGAMVYYRLLGADDRFVVRQPDCDHDFPPEVREEAYAFLDRVLLERDRGADR